MSDESKQVHVVMLPWLAFGHMIPFLELSIALANSHIHISFLSTPTNIHSLPQIPPHLSNFIQLVPLPLPNPPSDPLPESAESTRDIPAAKMDSLKKACDLMQNPIKDFIAKNSPNWIIVDFFPHWAADIAQELNIPLVTFYINNASTAVFFLLPELLGGESDPPPPRDLSKPPYWVDFPSKVAYKNHEIAAKKNVLSPVNSTGISDGARLMKLLRASRAVAMRTCPELEAEYLRVHSKVTGKPVFPVGFLPPQQEKVAGFKNRKPWDRIFRWLDKQDRRSVVFVGFGSEANISREQVREIAYGLELSGLPFVWALRGGGDMLPAGFGAEQGVVEVGWAPQVEILGHPCVGGIFVHAGWSSIIEAMQFGHVAVVLPLAVDQPMNARLMAEEKGLAVEVERDEDGWFSRDGVAEALKKAMLCDEMRGRVERASRLVFGNDEVNRKYVEEFAQYLKTNT